MDSVVKEAGDASNPTTFAKNVMEIAVPPSNPASIAGVRRPRPQRVKVALCQAQVPCGKVARQVFGNAKVSVTPVSDETDVKAVLTKVQLGEVDAGVVYVTDVKAAGSKVTGIEIPSDVNASTNYPIATLSKAPNPAAAAAFTAYVLSSAGTQVLTAAVFEALSGVPAPEGPRPASGRTARRRRPRPGLGALAARRARRAGRRLPPRAARGAARPGTVVADRAGARRRRGPRRAAAVAFLLLWRRRDARVLRPRRPAGLVPRPRQPAA